MHMNKLSKSLTPLLAGLAAGSKQHASGFHYLSNRVEGPGRLRFEASHPSAEACSDPLARLLWDLSAAAAGLKATFHISSY